MIEEAQAGSGQDSYDRGSNAWRTWQVLFEALEKKGLQRVAEQIKADDRLLPMERKELLNEALRAWKAGAAVARALDDACASRYRLGPTGDPPRQATLHHVVLQEEFFEHLAWHLGKTLELTREWWDVRYRRMPEPRRRQAIDGYLMCKPGGNVWVTFSENGNSDPLKNAGARRVVELLGLDPARYQDRPLFRVCYGVGESPPLHIPTIADAGANPLWCHANYPIDPKGGECRWNRTWIECESRPGLPELIHNAAPYTIMNNPGLIPDEIHPSQKV